MWNQRKTVSKFIAENNQNENAGNAGKTITKIINPKNPRTIELNYEKIKINFINFNKFG